MNSFSARVGRPAMGGVLFTVAPDATPPAGPIGPHLLARLMKQHGAALGLYARQLCADPEDAVQQAFISLAQQNVAPRDPVCWLYRVVRNAALTMTRAGRRRRKRELDAARARAEWFESTTEDQVDGASVAAVLESLPAEAREIVTAHLWGGLSFRQIGDLVGMSDSSVHRRYHDALRHIQEKLRAPCPHRHE